MNENEKSLEEARAQAKDFEEGLDPGLLEEAYLSLRDVLLLEEEDSRIRGRLRMESLHLWLHLLALLDNLLDPDFDPDDVPPRAVEPPPTSDGVELRPGADPAKITDPKARAEYRKAIAAHAERTARYERQTDLRRLDEEITPLAEEFIQNFYTPASRDQEELKSAVDEVIKDPKRKAALRKLLS